MYNHSVDHYDSTLGVDPVKVTNIHGNKFKKSIGKSISAKDWKGRNVLARHQKPINRDSDRQKAQRQNWKEGVAQWQQYTDLQKLAYNRHTKYYQIDVNNFNMHMRLYREKFLQGIAWLNPEGGHSHVMDSVSGLPIEGARLKIHKHSNTRIYVEGIITSLGYFPNGLLEWDENYDVYCSAEGYTPQSELNATAVTIVTRLFFLVAIP